MTEDELSYQVNKMLIELSMADRFSGVFFHVANEVKPPKMKPHQAIKFWQKRTRIGVKKGAFDWVIAWGANDFAFIELKRPATYKTSEKTGKQIIDKQGGRLSDEQIAFKRILDATGIRNGVFDNAQDVYNQLVIWGAVK